MTMFISAALAVTALIWVITEPPSPQDLTIDEIADYLVLGVV
jgi:hypothetical protein